MADIDRVRRPKRLPRYKQRRLFRENMERALLDVNRVLLELHERIEATAPHEAPKPIELH